jgi:signal transduction histidine kinase
MPLDNPAPAPDSLESAVPATGESARFVRLAETDGRAHAAATAPAASLCAGRRAVFEATTAAALSRENQRLHAKLRAQMDEVRSSRARLVAAADAERRRLERDLHDGAQARFVAVALHLARARAKAPADGEVAELLQTAIAELTSGLDELRELARGIHPAALTELGLDAALRGLAGRTPLPVEVCGEVGGRLAAPVEIAAYFAVSEALANVVKYAGALHATVEVRHRDGRLVVDVTDDGRGGAHRDGGSGLRGLADRVGALDGRLEVDSPQGGGTRVRVEIPCAAPVVTR